MFADQTTIPLIALYRAATDPAVTYTDGRITAGILWLDTSTGTIGTLKKRNEANSGWDTLIDFDAPALPDGSVTLAKLANLAQATVIGRASGAGTGVPVALSASQVKTILALVPGDITGFDTQVRTSRLDQMAAPTADVSINSHKLTNVTDPGSAQDAATKAYVDSQIGGGTSPTGSAGGDLSGTYPNPTVAQASKSFAFTGDISPSQLTADQNDWSPTGLSDASAIRVDTDANSGAGRSLTGLAGGADGRIIIIENVGSNPLRLKSENASSSAGNRFTLAVDIVLGSRRSATLKYDATSSRWRLLCTTAIALRHPVAISDESTALTTGTAKLTFRFATAVYLLQVRANLNTVSSSGNPAFDVNEAGVSIFSTTLTVDASEKTSESAATPAVISDPNIADDAEMTVDIDTAGTGAKGAKLTFIGWEI